MKIELNFNEADILVKLLDTLVRLTGFNSAKSAVVLLEKIEMAYQESLKEQEREKLKNEERVS